MWVRDEASMLELGRQLGRRAEPGTVVALTGTLGAGKSVFARGVARGLGLEGRIPSPTFVIMAEYLEGRLPLHHLDLYRIDDEDELVQLGLEDVLYGDGVVVVEWPERAAAWFDRALWVHLEIHDEGRTLRFDGPPALRAWLEPA